MGLILTILLNALAVLLAAYLLSGVTIKDYVQAILVALVLALLNATIGAVLDFLATPITWLTLGLFSLVIDAILIKIADYFLKGFSVRSFGWAFLMAVIIAVVNSLLGHFLHL